MDTKQKASVIKFFDKKKRKTVKSWNKNRKVNGKVNTRFNVYVPMNLGKWFSKVEKNDYVTKLCTLFNVIVGEFC